MNVLSAAGRLAALTHSSVHLNRERCLYAGDRFTTCTACQDLCPANAIRAAKPPELDEEACTGCRACLPACPVGAFTSGDDAVAELIDCVAHAETTSFELLCDRHPRPFQGLSTGALGLRVRGCLAGLGSGAYLMLAAGAHGAQHIVARLEACAACPWRSLEPRIIQQVGQAQQLLSALGRGEIVTAQTDPLLDPVERPVQSTQSPPLSRRDLWRQLSHEGRAAVARAWPVDKPEPPARMPARDRRRVNQAMAQLASMTDASLPATSPDNLAVLGRLGPGWACVTASGACTACGVCARVCPTGALRLDHTASDQFALRFIPRSCVGCEACVHVCGPAALTVDHAPGFQQVFGTEAVYTLRAGELAHCQRCHAPMAVRPGETLCVVCAQRQLNPFGARPLPVARGPLDSSEPRA